MNLRTVAAIAIVIQGAVHLQQYLDGFSAIAIIGPLFLINAIVSVAVAIWLMKSDGALPVMAGAPLLLGSLGSIFLTSTTGLFGYVSPSLGAAEITAIVFEVIGVIALGATVLTSRRVPSTA